MRFDLKEPCPNCPFRNNGARITFRGRERAEQIEEQAYRYGFPCHVSAKCDDDPVTGEEGFVFGDDTQHCAGYILLQLQEGSGLSWPGIDNDEELADRLAAQMDWNAAVFENAEAFINANSEESERPTAKAPAEQRNGTEGEDETHPPTRS